MEKIMGVQTLALIGQFGLLPTQDAIVTHEGLDCDLPYEKWEKTWFLRLESCMWGGEFQHVDISPPSGRSFTKHLEPRLPPSRDPNPTHPVLPNSVAHTTQVNSTVDRRARRIDSAMAAARCGVGWDVLMAFKQCSKRGWLVGILITTCYHLCITE